MHRSKRCPAPWNPFFVGWVEGVFLSCIFLPVHNSLRPWHAYSWIICQMKFKARKCDLEARLFASETGIQDSWALVTCPVSFQSTVMYRHAQSYLSRHVWWVVFGMLWGFQYWARPSVRLSWTSYWKLFQSFTRCWMIRWPCQGWFVAPSTLSWGRRNWSSQTWLNCEPCEEMTR